MYRNALGKMKRWLLQENEENDSRRALRSVQPEVVVYYWDGAAPEGRSVRDLSRTGAYIYTPERWYIGTIIRIILQHRKLIREDGTPISGGSACIPARVVRHGSDGVGVEFTFCDGDEAKALRAFLAAIPAEMPATAARAPSAAKDRPSSSSP